MKINPNDVRIAQYKACDIRRFILETPLHLASGQVEEAVLYLESAIKYTYEIEKFLRKLEEIISKEVKGGEGNKKGGGE